MIDWADADMPLAVVIGGCGGMGLAIVRRLAQRHAVILADRDADRAAMLAIDLRREGHSILAQPCDVTDPVSVAGLFELVARTAPLQSLAHVVGLSPSAGDWRAIMAVNLVGAARVAEAAFPLMARGGAGVFVASIAGHRVEADAALLALLDDPLDAGFIDALAARSVDPPGPGDAYRLSKHGLLRMCRRLAPGWGERGARIASMSPGLIRTPMGDAEFRNSPQKQGLLDRTPAGRQGTLNEACDAIEFLCSDRASFITGTDLRVDGGVVAAGEFLRAG